METQTKAVDAFQQSGEMVTETQKLNIVITQKMTDAINKYKEANNAISRDYDRRSKANRYAKQCEEEANAIVAAESKLQAEAYLLANNISLQNVAIITTSGQVAWRDFKPSAYLYIGSRKSFDLAESTVEKIKQQIQIAVDEKKVKQDVEALRIETANKMLQLVKDDITYKNSSWEYDKKRTDKWDGTELNKEFKTEDDWNEKAIIEAYIPAVDKVVISFNFRTEVKTPEDAKELWDAINKLIADKTKFVKKEAN